MNTGRLLRFSCLSFLSLFSLLSVACSSNVTSGDDDETDDELNVASNEAPKLKPGVFTSESAVPMLRVSVRAVWTIDLRDRLPSCAPIHGTVDGDRLNARSDQPDCEARLQLVSTKDGLVASGTYKRADSRDGVTFSQNATLNATYQRLEPKEWVGEYVSSAEVGPGAPKPVLRISDADANELDGTYTSISGAPIPFVARADERFGFQLTSSECEATLSLSKASANLYLASVRPNGRCSGALNELGFFSRRTR